MRRIDCTAFCRRTRKRSFVHFLKSLKLGKRPKQNLHICVTTYSLQCSTMHQMERAGRNTEFICTRYWGATRGRPKAQKRCGTGAAATLYFPMLKRDRSNRTDVRFLRLKMGVTTVYNDHKDESPWAKLWLSAEHFVY